MNNLDNFLPESVALNMILKAETHDHRPVSCALATTLPLFFLKIKLKQSIPIKQAHDATFILLLL